MSGTPKPTLGRPRATLGRRATLALLMALAFVHTGARPRAPDDDLPVVELRTELWAVLSRQRPYRLRLSISPPYQPCPQSPAPSVNGGLCGGTGSPAAAPALDDVARLAELSTAAGRSPEADHLRGLVPLAIGGPSQRAVDRSLALLERALAGASDDPALLQDVAVALALRADLGGDPKDRLRALVHLDRAQRLAPGDAAVAFDRALVLEAVGFTDGARLAWRWYLDQFDEPGFGAEARASLARTETALAGVATTSRLVEIAAEVGHGRSSPALDLVAGDPQKARELGMEHLLAAWGEARLSGDPLVAERQLAAARQLGARLAAAHGECSVRSMVEAIDAVAGDRRRLDRLAEAHRAYAQGASLFAHLRYGESSPFFERARLPAGEGDALAAWARMGSSGVVLFRDVDRAALGFSELLDDTAGGCLHALSGRAAWGLGLTRLRQGRYSAALRHFSAAERVFRDLDEAENLAAVEGLLGETFDQLGQGERAWAFWFRSLAAIGDRRGSLRLHNLLWGMARGAETEIGPEAALVLQEECVRNAERSDAPGLLPEALLWRSRFLAARGDLERSLADLDAAARFNAERGPGTAPERVAADLTQARGLVLAGHDDEAARDLLSTALRYYREQRQVLPQAETLLARARVLRRAGQPRLALADLEAGLALFREQRDRVVGNELRRSFTETVQATFEEEIDLAVDDLGVAPEETLRLAEDARDVAFAWSPVAKPAPPVSLRRVTDALGDDGLLAYAATPSRLHVWYLHAGGVDHVTVAVSREDLERRVHAFVTAVRRGDGLDDLAGEARELGRLLLPAAVGTLPPQAVLYVVPDRALSALPFDLLREPADGRLLVEEHPVAFAPSLRSLVASLDLSASKGSIDPGITLVADPAHDRDLFPFLPGLPQARREVERIGRLYPETDLLTGGEATPEAVLSRLDRHPVLHYAGHAVFDPQRPARSFLPLAPSPQGDSVLFAPDLARRPLRQLRLVVLSACTTLGPTERRTVAISGIARPFLDAGAGAVVGTLWPVTDVDSARLLPEFHRRFAAGDDAVRALWEAKLDRVHRTETSASPPARWAAFQIVGQARLH